MAVGTQAGPDGLDRGDLRSVWRPGEQGDVIGHDQGLGAMPTGTFAHENGARALGNPASLGGGPAVHRAIHARRRWRVASTRATAKTLHGLAGTLRWRLEDLKIEPLLTAIGTNSGN